MTNPSRIIALRGGREQHFVPQLDFRVDTKDFDDADSCELSVLEPGTVVGFTAPFHWRDGSRGHSLRVAFHATHTGEAREIYVPKNKYHPTSQMRRTESPLFDVTVTSLERRSSLTEHQLGSVAIPYVLPNRYPYISKQLALLIGIELNVDLGSFQTSHIDHVEPQSIYYITPQHDGQRLPAASA